MDIVMIPIERIKPYKKNPRLNDSAVKYVAESIYQFGFKVPLVLDKKYEVVCGHTRLKAAKELGLNEVPCVIADDLSKEQIKAFRLADNKVAEQSKWDEGLLNLELEEIFSIDMDAFGFDTQIIDEHLLDEPKEKENERERTVNAYNLDEIDLSRCAGRWQMPILKATQHVPDDLISFNYMLNTDDFGKGIHFYIDDYQFERVWNKPRDYIERMAQFDCILTPDFSLYQEMPLAMQMWNVFRSRLLGQIWQDAGLTVIPTLQWCRRDSLDFCFDGIEKGGVVSVSTIGVKTDKESKKLFFDGMDRAIEVIQPSKILVYGGDIGFKYECEAIYINNHNTERMKESQEPVV